MTFDELWKALPIPVSEGEIDDANQKRWKLIVESAFRTGLFEGAHKSASAKTADSKRISNLEAAVEEILAALKKDMADAEQHHKDVCAIHAQDLRGRDARISQLCESERRLKAELRAIREVFHDPLDDRNAMTVVEKIKGLQSALRVIYNWCCYQDSFDLKHVKDACLLALWGSK